MLRQWRGDDLDAFAAMMRDPEVTQFIGGPIDRAAAWRMMALYIGHWALRGWSQAAVVERATGRLVGRGGLWLPEGWPGLEVGWVLERASWGKGYASELGRAARDFAFARLQARNLIALIDAHNVASVHVASAIDLRLDGRVDLNGAPVLMYRQARADWDMRPGIPNY